MALLVLNASLNFRTSNRYVGSVDKTETLAELLIELVQDNTDFIPLTENEANNLPLEEEVLTHIALPDVQDIVFYACIQNMPVVLCKHLPVLSMYSEILLPPPIRG